METSTAGLPTRCPPKVLGEMRHFLWESRIENVRWRSRRKGNNRRRGICNETNSWSNQFGRGREEFQLRGYSHIVPQTHTRSSCILRHLELLRQLRPKVFLTSNWLSPFVCFVCVPHFRQWKDILYPLLLLLFSGGIFCCFFTSWHKEAMFGFSVGRGNLNWFYFLAITSLWFKNTELFFFFFPCD